MAKRAASPKTVKSAPEPSTAAVNDAASEVAVAHASVKPYVVFARRFRPASFSDVVGQTATTSALRQALTSGRLAQAYLFCGPRGVGKTSLARIVAKALNCLKGTGPGGISDEPCNSCAACEAIQNGHSLDVIEMDAATNRGIEEIRSLRDNVGLSPAELRFKVYIIDEVHMLTKEAWNAFLKTLEEPPAHVKFIFATTDPNNVPETILSRCQRYDLRRIGPADIVKRLKQICEEEKLQFEETALYRIANLSKGGLRDAEGLLDQAVNLGQGKVTDAVVRDLSGAAPDELIFELLTNCAKGRSSEVLLKVHQALEAGADPEDLLSELIERLRGTLLAKVCGTDSALLGGQTHLKDMYAALGTLLSEDQCLMLLQLFGTGRRQMRDASQTRLPLEMALIRASRAADLVDLGKLVSALESSPAATSPPRPQPPNLEGSRPNLEGRPAAIVNPPAAAQETTTTQDANPQVQSASEIRAVNSGSGAGSDAWATVVAAARKQKGGAFLASALSHAAAIQLDANANVLTIGFAAEELFYRDALEKPHSQSALQQALNELFGRAFQVQIQRVTERKEIVVIGNVPIATTVASVSSVPQSPSVRKPVAMPAASISSATSPAPWEEPIRTADDSDEEFDGAEELPLRGEINSQRSDESELAANIPVEDGDVPPVEIKGPAVPVPIVPAVTYKKTLDSKLVEDHPLVQLVLKESGGRVMSVTQK